MQARGPLFCHPSGVRQRSDDPPIFFPVKPSALPPPFKTPTFYKQPLAGYLPACSLPPALCSGWTDPNSPEQRPLGIWISRDWLLRVLPPSLLRPPPPEWCGMASAPSTDGSLYMWGINNQGQLGLGDTVNRLHPGAHSQVWGGIVPPCRLTGGFFYEVNVWFFQFPPFFIFNLCLKLKLREIYKKILNRCRIFKTIFSRNKKFKNKQF